MKEWPVWPDLGDFNNNQSPYLKATSTSKPPKLPFERKLSSKVLKHLIEDHDSKEFKREGPKLESERVEELKHQLYLSQLKSALLVNPERENEIKIDLIEDLNTERVNYELEEDPIHLELKELENIRSNPKTQYHIPTLPFMELETLDLAEDFYLNLIAWSAKDIVAMGIRNQIHLWDVQNGLSIFFAELDHPDMVTSVTWCPDGIFLAVGDSKGMVHIYDATTNELIRSVDGHLDRVSAMVWVKVGLATGSKDTNIFLRDFRIRNDKVTQFQGHKHDVCGLKWDANGDRLASGSMDSLVHIWEPQSIHPVKSLSGHRAAVKALAWSPSQTNLLATGTGYDDRHLRIWDINGSNSDPIQSIDTGTQITGLEWSSLTNDLISSHGYTTNQLVIWRYPSLNQITKLSHQTNRITYMSISPDHTKVATGAGEESLCFWDIYKKPDSEEDDNDSWDEHKRYFLKPESDELDLRSFGGAFIR